MPLPRVVRASALVVPLLAVAAASHAAVYHYSAILNPRQEVPLVASAGMGGGRFTIDTDANTVRYWISFGGLSSAETAAHIHGFAAPGANAGVVVALPALALTGTSWDDPSSALNATIWPRISPPGNATEWIFAYVRPSRIAASSTSA